MSAPDGIEAFAVAALDRLGGAAEQDAPGLYSVLWPDPASADVEARRLAFDPEALEDAPDAELVTFASAALDELVGLATASGRVARAFLNAPVTTSRAAAERLARSYRFLDATWAPEAGRPRWLPAGVFLFRVRYLSDSREEEIHEVALSLAGGGILRRLADAIERYGLASDPAEAWPMTAEMPAGAVHAAARAELERRLLAPMGRRRRELEARLARESGRAGAYYEELAREATAEMERLPSDAGGRARQEGRLQAIRLEREARLAELRAKYRLHAEVSLLSVLRLHMPRVAFPGTLAGKRDQAALTLVWDPVEQTAEPARCRRCLDGTYELGLDRTGQVACPRCIAATPAPRRR